MNDLPWHLWAMSLLYIFAGIMHFIKPAMYKAIMPKYIPMHWLMVYLSGIAEIGLGVMLLFEETREFALLGIMLMLILFLIIHFYMVTDEFKTKLPRWIFWFRIPLQFVLIYWAYSYLSPEIF